MGSSHNDSSSPSDLASDAKAGSAQSQMSSHAAQAGWIGVLGLEVTRATKDEVIAVWSVDERHLQPRRIVHGGVYASVVETCCSIGAWLAAPPGKAVVGVENHTSFVRAVSQGTLRARARPLHAGRRAQLWECTIEDEAERLVATGRLRLMCIDEDRGAETASAPTESRG